MWNQWPGVMASMVPPMPPATAAPPQPPLPDAPPPATAAPPVEPTVAPTVSIIGPMLPIATAAAAPSPNAATALAAGTSDPNNPYGQYTAAQYAAMTPEQQFAIQQHWQQWQAYQQEYAKWHAQYGEQYKREMAAATSPVVGGGTSYTSYYQQQPPPPVDNNQVQSQPQQPSRPSSYQQSGKISGPPQKYQLPPPVTQNVSQPPVPLGPHQLYQQQQPIIPQQQQWPTQQNFMQPPSNFNQPPPNFQQQPPLTNFKQNIAQPPPSQPPNNSGSMGQNDIDPNKNNMNNPNNSGPPPSWGANQTNAPNQWGTGGPNQWGSGGPNQWGSGGPNQWGLGGPNQWNGPGSSQNNNERFGFNKWGAGNTQSGPNSCEPGSNQSNSSTGPNNQWGQNNMQSGGPNRWNDSGSNQGNTGDAKDQDIPDGDKEEWGSNEDTKKDFDSSDNERNDNENAEESQWNENQNNQDSFGGGNSCHSNQSDSLGTGFNDRETNQSNFAPGNTHGETDKNSRNNNNRSGADNWDEKNTPNNRGNNGPMNWDNNRRSNSGNNSWRPDGPNDSWGNDNSNNWGPNNGPNNRNNNGPNNLNNNGPNNRDNNGPNNRDNNGPNNRDNNGPNNYGLNNRSNYGRNNRDNYGPNNRDNFGSNNRDNYGPNNRDNFGCNNRDNYGSNNRDNFGPNNRGNYGPNNRDNYGPNNRDNYGPNNRDNYGPNNSDNSGPNNRDNNGPNNRNQGNFGNQRGLGTDRIGNNQNRENSERSSAPWNSDQQNYNNDNDNYNSNRWGNNRNEKNFGPNDGPNNRSNRWGNQQNNNNSDQRNQGSVQNQTNMGSNEFNQGNNMSNRQQQQEPHQQQQSHQQQQPHKQSQPQKQQQSQQQQSQQPKQQQAKQQSQQQSMQPQQLQQQKRAAEIDEENFDRQFRQWQQQFEDWKRANANHPDREMYKRYEQEFEKQRIRIMERREQIRKRNIELMGGAAESSPSESSRIEQIEIATATDIKNQESKEESTLNKVEINIESENQLAVAQKLDNQSELKTPSKNKQELIDKPKLPLNVNKGQKAEEKKQSLPSKEQAKTTDTKPDSLKKDAVKLETSTPAKVVVVDDIIINKGLPVPSDISKDPKDTPSTSTVTPAARNANTKARQVGILGKRKSRFDIPTEVKPSPPIQTTEVILLEDDEVVEDAKPAGQCSETMKEIFKKSDGIPGLDLVEGSDNKVIDNEQPKVNPVQSPDGPTRPPKMSTINTSSATKKIPSLFDIVIEKPPTSPLGGGNISDQDSNMSMSSDQTNLAANIQAAAGSMPDLANALKDPEFMGKISDALARAQGLGKPNVDSVPPQQFLQQLPGMLQQLQEQQQNSPKNFENDGRQMSFAEWQRRKSGNGSGFGCNDGPNRGNGPNFGGNGSNFAGNGSNFGGNGPNFGGNGRNFGGNGPFGGGNGPNFGGNDPNFGGNGPNFGGNGSNFGGNGPNFRNFGPNRDGDNRPNFGGNGPNFGGNGPNFGNNFRNFGGNGPNNFDNSNYRGGNSPNFGPNRGGNGPNFGPNRGGNGPNFGNNEQNFGNNGPNFGNNGPNFGNNGPNFGGNGSNFRGNGPNFRGNHSGAIDNANNNRNQTNNFAEDNEQNQQRNTSNASNPFRRSGGPNIPVFNEGNAGGKNNKNSDKGGDSQSQTTKEDSNASWINGPGVNKDNADGGYFRPMQVIDYKNCTMGKKVIDYGHKTSDRQGFGMNNASSSMKEEFKPVQTFDYGHSSKRQCTETSANTAVVAAGSQNQTQNANPNANQRKNNTNTNNNKNNKRSNTNNRNNNNNTNSNTSTIQNPTNLNTNLNSNSKPNQNANPIESINKKQKPVNTEQKQPTSQRQQQPADKQKERQQQPAIKHDSNCNKTAENTANLNAAKTELDELSDNDDNVTEAEDVVRCDSPAPPPPPMFFSNDKFIAVPSSSTAPTSIFPSTATANDDIPTTSSSHVQMCIPSTANQNTITIDEILLKPGRLTRPKKICIILRGPPGSGKSHVAKLIKEKENEMGGSNPRILSIDDYFLIENDYEERCPKTGKKIPKKEILYEYDKDMEENYMQYLIKQFKKTIMDNLYDFIIVDCNNNSLRTLNEFYCHSKDSGFMPYIIDLFCNAETCLSHNIHERLEKDINDIIETWKPTPFHYIKLDVSSLLENVIEMEDAEDMVMDDNFTEENADNSNDVSEEQSTVSCAANEIEENNDVEEDDDSNESAIDPNASFGFLKSKWECDTTSENLARLDGTSKLMTKRKTATMQDYLQMDEWQPSRSNSSGKRVRWADIEEKNAQEKMRAIGFVVGQTDWKRMMDPNAARHALNRTKFIDRVYNRRSFKK